MTCILDDAKVFANHSRKKSIELDDVKLALELILDKAFTTPPSRHVLAKLAEVRNSMPLPPVKPHCGLRLPPDRYCLSACNYKLRNTVQGKKLTKSALEGRVNAKGSPAMTMKKQNMGASKSMVVSVPKPVFKFTTAPKPTTLDDSVKMEVDHSTEHISSLKREREDDEFQMV